MAKRELQDMELGMVNGGSWWGDILETAGEVIETGSKIASGVVEKITGVEAVKEASELYQEFAESYIKKIG